MVMPRCPHVAGMAVNLVTALVSGGKAMMKKRFLGGIGDPIMMNQWLAVFGRGCFGVVGYLLVIVII